MTDIDPRSLEELLLSLAEFGQIVSSAMADAAGDGAIVDNQSVIVLAILDLEGPQRPRDLQERLGLSSGGTTKVVDRLARRGLVDRSYGTIPSDLRGVLVSLTDDGRERLRAMTVAAAEHLPGTAVLVKEIDRLLHG